MRTQVASLFFFACLISLGCQKEEEAPPPQYPQQQPYGQQPYGQPPYGQPAPAPAPAPAPTTPPVAPAPTTTTAPAPAAAGQLATPGPLALPCTTDANCVTHRCNTAFGKCAAPCQTDADCNPGNKCQMPGPTGICIPAPQ